MEKDKLDEKLSILTNMIEELSKENRQLKRWKKSYEDKEHKKESDERFREICY